MTGKGELASLHISGRESVGASDPATQMNAVLMQDQGMVLGVLHHFRVRATRPRRPKAACRPLRSRVGRGEWFAMLNNSLPSPVVCAPDRDRLVSSQSCHMRAFRVENLAMGQ
jgi:hypothetical protein